MEEPGFSAVRLQGWGLSRYGPFRRTVRIEAGFIRPSRRSGGHLPIEAEPLPGAATTHTSNRTARNASLRSVEYFRSARAGPKPVLGQSDRTQRMPHDHLRYHRRT